MELSHSCEVQSRPATPGIRNMLRNPKVSLQCPQELTNGTHMNPAHTAPFYFSKIYFNIVLSSKSTFRQWRLSLWFCQLIWGNDHFCIWRHTFGYYLLLGPKYFTMNFNGLPTPFAIFSTVPVPSGGEEVTCLVTAASSCIL